jgi:hypothetical protein
VFFFEKKNQKTFSSAARRLTIALGVAGLVAASAEQPALNIADNGKPYLEVPADPAHKFNYPYILFTPPQLPSHCPLHLFVEPVHGPGVSADDQQLNDARAAAVRVAAHSSLGSDMAQHFGFPLLVPVFPRPPLGKDSDLDIYSLSRAALLANGKLQRVDLQLIAMIADAQQRLSTGGATVDPKILMTGFSGSGLFTSRFVFLHPSNVLAAAFGGLNSFVTLPTATWHGRALEFPLGLADYARITGHEFDKQAYDAVPQIAFQGENDDNDAIPNDDEYTTAERDLVWALFGRKMFPDRWHAVQAAYKAAGSTVAFRTYTQIGHSYDQRALNDVAGLFTAALADDSKCLPP